jgi:putative acetyltransferase
LHDGGTNRRQRRALPRAARLDQIPRERTMRIALERPDQPDVVSLVDELDAYQKPLYPPESHHGIDIEALGQPGVLFAVVRSAEGAAIGCGAVVLSPDCGELKRMYVRPQHRGRGVAKALLAFLEASAVAQGCTLLMLETGVSQPEALGLYERAGYVRRGPFGSYTHDPFSIFMQKRVGGWRAGSACSVFVD